MWSTALVQVSSSYFMLCSFHLIGFSCFHNASQSLTHPHLCSWKHPVTLMQMYTVDILYTVILHFADYSYANILLLQLPPAPKPLYVVFYILTFMVRVFIRGDNIIVVAAWILLYHYKHQSSLIHLSCSTEICILLHMYTYGFMCNQTPLIIALQLLVVIHLQKQWGLVGSQCSISQMCWIGLRSGLGAGGLSHSRSMSASI